ncbi:MAG: ribbon-helix-helix domain-containing protein [Alphaproteobacteria bacterium]|jgi:predicted DNA-binding ribbon-helix-helix protein|nr:ribbon-helix-helix domain-containing protein [Alphaproteobacteria bacterium]MDP6622202.1 ribbon-helix-helix domain-containing protein [Alphaproteobacteria bacterium]
MSNSRKRSVRIAGHPTSVSLEPEFWAQLKRLAAARGLSLNALITGIDAQRNSALSGALRVFVLRALEDQLAELRNASV